MHLTGQQSRLHIQRAQNNENYDVVCSCRFYCCNGRMCFKPQINNSSRYAMASNYYTVRSGDTLSGIAMRYGLDYLSIAEMNGIAPPYRIYVNQSLRLKKSSSPRTVSTQVIVAQPELIARQTIALPTTTAPTTTTPPPATVAPSTNTTVGASIPSSSLRCVETK